MVQGAVGTGGPVARPDQVSLGVLVAAVPLFKVDEAAAVCGVAEQRRGGRLPHHCPEHDALTRHVRSFATMLTDRQRERFPEWLDEVRQDDLPSLHILAAGIDRDLDAVIAGLTLPCSSGAVEGHVNPMKMIKRRMYGRAGCKLLRERVLLAS